MTNIKGQVNNAKPYECEVCNKRFSKSSNLTWHRRTHATKKQHLYKCDFCKKQLSDPASLRVHINRAHNKEKPHGCNVCHKQYVRARSLRVHKKMHAAEKSHECNVCKKKFTTLGYLKMHIKRMHLGKDVLKCGVCMKTFSNSTSVTVHKLTHTSENSHKCGLSKKKNSEATGSTGNNRQHTIKRKNIHFKEQTTNDKKLLKKYECGICGKRFSKSRYLSQHLKFHTGKRPHQCIFCKKRFSLKHHLKRHMASLHPELTVTEKPHECGICSKKYWDKVSFEKHSISHSRERMLLCSMCGSEVFQSQDFQESEKSMDDQYDCNKCEECFSNFKSLIQHHAWDHGATYRCDVCQELDTRSLTDIGDVCFHYDTTFDSSEELVQRMDSHENADFV